jgi:hypothetical protein
MAWNIAAIVRQAAQQSTPSTSGSGTTSDPAPAPAPGGSNAGGSNAAGSKRKVKWAPDYSTFIFEDEHPGAVWQGSRALDPWEASSPVAPAGFYTPDQQVFGPDGAYNAGGHSIAPFQGEWDPWSGGYIGRTDPYWSDFERAGLLDLTPGSDLWKHLQSKPGVARYGDVMSDPMAHFTALQSLYSMSPHASFRQGGKIYRARHNDYVGVRDDLIARGYDPETAQAIARGMDQYAEAASRSDDDMFKLEDITKDIVGGLGQILQVAPIRAAMLAMSLGGSGLFGELGAAGGAAGELGQDFLAEELLAGAPELAGAYSLDATTGLAGAMPTGGMLGETPAADYDWLSDKAANTTLATRAVADPALSGIPIDGSYLDLAEPAAAGATQEPDLLDQVKETYDTVSKYGKVIKAVESILGSAVPDGAPERREGQDDAAYSADLAEYMNLDAAAMAELGLQPGSPEYMQYILQQADAIIEQVLAGMDVNADDISEQLRSKTAEEMAQLQRALYVRGTLDQMMGSGTYTDPFTGTEQEVLGEGTFNPNVGAYQRGLAGSFQNISRSGDPLGDINELLGRRADLFGMQERADEQFERAKLEDDIRKRRGIMSY